MSNTYETAEWPKDFIEVTMIALKKKSKATKCRDHCTVSLIAHTAKTVAKILLRKIERKLEDILGEDQFGFRRGKGTRNENRMPRIMSVQTLEVDWNCVLASYWQKAFDFVKWAKLMHILKETGISWSERRLVSRLYVDQSVKV
jgi:hypothetical protein